MVDRPQFILVLAQSARMLVQACQYTDFKPLANDLWGDLDTRRSAVDFLQVPLLTVEYLMPALDYFASHYPIAGVVYGSGFEQHLDSLKCVADRLTVFGNQPEVFANLQNKPAFFALLNVLGVPYPEIAFSKPDEDEGWLVKPIMGQGGLGIRRYRANEDSSESCYWQKYQQGEPHSVLFLADGKKAQVIGFNRQWTTSLSENQAFIFSGIINSTQLSSEEKALITDWLDKIVPALSLVGLNSLDFIQSEQASYVLEINPRPPASMQLYDADLLVRHIKACQGKLLDYDRVQVGFAGYQIIYARRNIEIPDDFEWPEGTVDLPNANAIINTGQPICSMIVRGKEPDKVLEQLQIRQELIIHQLDRFQIHGIQCQR